MDGTSAPLPNPDEAAASTARFSGQLLAFLRIFGWGLFAAARVPAGAEEIDPGIRLTMGA